MALRPGGAADMNGWSGLELERSAAELDHASADGDRAVADGEVQRRGPAHRLALGEDARDARPGARRAKPAAEVRARGAGGGILEDRGARGKEEPALHGPGGVARIGEDVCLRLAVL